MAKKIINISVVIGDSVCITTEDARVLRNEITKALKMGDQVQLDFSDVSDVTTAFLNEAVGALYFDFESDFLKQNMIPPLNADNWVIEKLSRSVQRAKEVLVNPDRFRQAAEEIMGN